MIDSNVEGPWSPIAVTQMTGRAQVLRAAPRGRKPRARGVDNPDATMGGVDHTASTDRARIPPKQRWADFGSDRKSHREIRTVAVGRFAPRPTDRKTLVAAGSSSREAAHGVAEGPPKAH